MIKVETDERGTKVEIRGNNDTLMKELQALKKAIIELKKEVNERKNGKI